MSQKVHAVPFAARPDPARDAARLLGWLGLAALMVGAPLVGVLSRRALFVLLPVGGGILVAAYLLSASTVGLQVLRAGVRQPLGLAGLFLVGWTGLSLVWTPFPGDAVPRFVATAAVLAFAALVIAHLPERRATRALFLLPVGLAVTAVATLGLALVGPPSFRGGTEFDPSLLERSVLTLVVLVWPAIGALGAFGLWWFAAALLALVVGAAGVAGASIALAACALGALAFASAVDAPRRTAWVAAVVVAGAILLAPALPFGLAPLAQAIPPVGKSTVAAMADWRNVVVQDGPRLITGHGFDTARPGELLGFLPPHTPRAILFEVWYELGFLGALALASVAALGLLAAAGAARAVVPSLLAGIVATLTICTAGVATAELWFVTLVSLQAIGFGLLCRSSGEGVRPVAGPLADGGATLAPPMGHDP